MGGLCPEPGPRQDVGKVQPHKSPHLHFAMLLWWESHSHFTGEATKTQRGRATGAGSHTAAGRPTYPSGPLAFKASPFPSPASSSPTCRIRRHAVWTLGAFY